MQLGLETAMFPGAVVGQGLSWNTQLFRDPAAKQKDLSPLYCRLSSLESFHPGQSQGLLQDERLRLILGVGADDEENPSQKRGCKRTSGHTSSTASWEDRAVSGRLFRQGKESSINYGLTPLVNPDLLSQSPGCRHKCWGCDGWMDGVLEMMKHLSNPNNAGPFYAQNP